MSLESKISKKVILLGHFGVGKSSLIKRFIHDMFSEEYKTTIGVKVDKKVIEVGDRELTMIIWDIEGGAVQSKLPKSYFLGAHGIIYVFDLTRPSTYENIDTELSFFRDLLPKAKLQIVGNKIDLLDELQMHEFKTGMEGKYNVLSSAKTGEMVEEMFHALGLDMVS